MNRFRPLLLSLVLILSLAVLAACGTGDDDSDAGDQATESSQSGSSGSQSTSSSEQATEEEDDDATEAADDEPTEASDDEDATEASDDEDEPTKGSDDEDEPTEESDSGSADSEVVGSASVEDERDDVANILMQDPDEPMPGIDLTNVQIDADGSEIVVTIQTAGDIAAELSDDVEVSFDVHLWQEDRPAYAMSFHLNGDDWEATITDFTSGSDETTIDTPIDLSGSTLTAAFPIDMMAELEPEFQWYSSVMLSEGGFALGPDSWFDGAPENIISLLTDPEQFVEFPQ